MTMSSNLAFEEPSPIAARQRRNWAVRPEVYANQLPEGDLRYAPAMVPFQRPKALWLRSAYWSNRSRGILRLLVSSEFLWFDQRRAMRLTNVRS